MKVYSLSVVSQRNCIILFCIYMVGLVRTLFLMLPRDEFRPYLITETVVFAILCLMLATGRTEWRVDQEGVSIKWTRRFALSKQPDSYIAWKELENIRERTDGLYKWLKLTLVSGKKLRFYHFSLDTPATYRELVAEMKAHILIQGGS